MYNDNITEMREALITLMEVGRAIALIVNRELKFFHVEHTDDEMLKRSLTVEQVKRFWKRND